MKIPCSNCNQRLEIPEELAGQTIDCPACNATLAVPALETPPPAVPQVQESAPQAASSKKSKSSIPKWAIASVAGIAVLAASFIIFFSDAAVKTDGESQQLVPASEGTPVEPVAEAATPKTATIKAPDISLHKAAENGNIEAVKQHIAAGTDVNAKLGRGYTALQFAAHGGHKGIAQLLIAAGADVNAKDDDGDTPIDEAIINDETETADLLRKHGGKTGEGIPVPHIDSNPAVWAEAVKQAIADGADVNSQKDEVYGSENAPLHYAVGWDLTETIELLIANGANVNAQEKRGFTPLDFAESKTAALLRKHGGKTRKQLPAISVHDAARAGNIKAVKQYLAAGTNVNAKSNDGTTPLHKAALKGHKEIAELLITKGADVNAKSRTGTTPLHLATWGHTKIIELLIANGADVNAKSNGGITPLDYPMSNNDKKIADLLRKHGGKTGEELKVEGK